MTLDHTSDSALNFETKKERKRKANSCLNSRSEVKYGFTKVVATTLRKEFFNIDFIKKTRECFKMLLNMFNVKT